jgi:NAD(P)-dependent dehydrogenase (short-subunit alcohol dehydrogenase family)
MVRFVPFLVAAATCASFRGANAFVPAASSSPVRVSSSSAIGAPGVVTVANRVPSRPLSAMLTETELPEKIYLPEDKEAPKALGGLKIGTRRLTVITGASSGLGLNCAVALAKTGRHFVIMACRDVEKGKRVAKEMGMPENSYTVMKLELGSLQSVRDFVFNLKAFKSIRPVQNLICNAAVYRPTDPEPAWTDDGFEASMGINHFGHFLLVNLLVDDMAKSKDARICIVGSITGNTNTVGEFLFFFVPPLSFFSYRSDWCRRFAVCAVLSFSRSSFLSLPPSCTCPFRPRLSHCCYYYYYLPMGRISTNPCFPPHTPPSPFFIIHRTIRTIQAEDWYTPRRTLAISRASKMARPGPSPWPMASPSSARRHTRIPRFAT